MPDLCLTRRASFLLPLLLAACGGEPESFPPLRYNYLPSIGLNVATIAVQQRFYPSGVAPDITDLDPVHPVEALRAMADDRLQALGNAGEAVFAITNASLTRQDDVITCALAAVLEIYPTPGVRSGFAEAVASRQHSGHIDDLRRTLYDLTKGAMNAMNVEFEYQVRRSLRPWLAVAAAPPQVQQQPLQTGPDEQSPAEPPAPGMPPTPQSPMSQSPMSQSPPGMPPMPPAPPQR